MLFSPPQEPGWRNWQTQRTQNPPTFGSWGFDSPSRHQNNSNVITHLQPCRAVCARAGSFLVVPNFVRTSIAMSLQRYRGDARIGAWPTFDLTQARLFN